MRHHPDDLQRLSQLLDVCASVLRLIAESDLDVDAQVVAKRIEDLAAEVASLRGEGSQIRM